MGGPIVLGVSGIFGLHDETWWQTSHNSDTSPGSVPDQLIVSSRGPARPFDGSPTPSGQPFRRIIADSQAYSASAATRPTPNSLSKDMAESPADQAYSPDIVLGLVFLGQFVDHDITLMNVTGQGPVPDPSLPLDMRNPALDLDSVYGKGPHDQPEFYTPDGLFFQLGANGRDLLRDANGKAIIGDERNDDNGMLAMIQVAFQRYHNKLMTEALDGVDPNRLGQRRKDMLFDRVHRQVVAVYQGIVANELAPALSGHALPENVAPNGSLPIEFSSAVYRLGHSLVPNTVVVDHQGNTKSPVDPSLRGPNGGIPFDLLFGPNAQHAAKFDDKIADVMRVLLIPFSPTDPSQGDLIGGDSPNIGPGEVINGVMHLDLVETNIMRGRELKLPSGEEYLAMLDGRPYDPAKDGNTDLFVYILHEAAPLGHLGRVGADVFDKGLGGILAADPYRYNNPSVFTPQQIEMFRNGTFEGLLHAIGEPGF